MNLIRLTEEEYRSKLSSKMFEVTEKAEAILDIWPYVKKLVKNKIIPDYVYANYVVEYVYRDAFEKYDHILLPTGNLNTFIVLVIDIVQENIDGYYVLNLIHEYGLS